MTHERTSPSHDAANHWLAFQYLSGDLIDSEAAAFEARLAGDAALQTALADAVSLTTGLAQCVRQPATHRAATRTHASRWPVGLTTAAVCLLGLGLLLQSLPVSTNHVADEDDPVNVSSVVSLWSALGPEILSGSNENEHRLLDQEQAEIDVPDWMLLAVLDEFADGIEPESEGGRL